MGSLGLTEAEEVVEEVVLGEGVMAAATRGTNTGAVGRSATLFGDTLGVAGVVTMVGTVGIDIAAGDKLVVGGGSRGPESLAGATA